MESFQQTRDSRGEFDVLLHRNYVRAYKLAFRFTGNRTDAEDLTQDAFLRAWESFDRYDRHRSFDVWLQRVLYNLAIDRWRRSGPLTRSLDSAAVAEQGAEPLESIVAHRGPSPEQQCLLDDQAAHIRRVMRQLPENYRTAILLRDVEEWSYTEVAEKMRCSVGTVRSRLHRGRQLLRRLLHETQAEGAQHRPADASSSSRLQHPRPGIKPERTYTR